MRVRIRPTDILFAEEFKVFNENWPIGVKTVVLKDHEDTTDPGSECLLHESYLYDEQIRDGDYIVTNETLGIKFVWKHETFFDTYEITQVMTEE